MTQKIEPLAVSPTQASFLTSLSKRMIQDLMSRGVLPFRKVGRRTVIPFDALKDFLSADRRQGQSKPDAKPAAEPSEPPPLPSSQNRQLLLSDDWYERQTGKPRPSGKATRRDH